MKPSIYIFLLLPLLILAQTSDQQLPTSKEDVTANARTELRGIVLAIDGNKINFEECWMLPSTLGMPIIGIDDEDLEFSALQAPFYAEIDIYWHNGQTHISRLKVLKQFAYGQDGIIIGEYNESDTK